MLLVAALSACSGSDASPPPEVTSAPSTGPSGPTGNPSTEVPSTRIPSTTTAPTTAKGSTGGLDVRYLDEDGGVKTIKVRDFRR